jgi:hypothetical protein
MDNPGDLLGHLLSMSERLPDRGANPVMGCSSFIRIDGVAERVRLLYNLHFIIVTKR